MIRSSCFLALSRGGQTPRCGRRDRVLTAAPGCLSCFQTKFNCIEWSSSNYRPLATVGPYCSTRIMARLCFFSRRSRVFPYTRPLGSALDSRSPEDSTRGDMSCLTLACRGNRSVARRCFGAVVFPSSIRRGRTLTDALWTVCNVFVTLSFSRRGRTLTAVARRLILDRSLTPGHARCNHHYDMGWVRQQ